MSATTKSRLPGAIAIMSLRAFNEDKPYDRFVAEQLAGDELEHPTPRRLDRHRLLSPGRVGRRAGRRPHGRVRRAGRYDRDDQRGLHGSDRRLRRCHDHMFDPISQADYYRLLAFFRNVRPYQKPHVQREFGHLCSA